MIYLKPSINDPKVGISVYCDYTTPEGIGRLIKALQAAQMWLKSAQAKK